MQRHKRRPLRPERLHPYSRGFHDFLLRERPVWLSRAFNVLGYHHEQFDLEVELPHPAGSKPIGRLRLPAEPLQLWMNCGEELSISFWEWHGHAGMGSPAGHPAEEDYREIVELVDGIMADGIVFHTAYQDGRCVGSGSVKREYLEEVLAGYADDADVDDVIVRSWSGKLDRRLR